MAIDEQIKTARPFNDFKEPSAEEFEAAMAPRREALQRLVTQSSVHPYRNLTLRQMASFLKAATGGYLPMQFDLSYLESAYDMDSPDDFGKWENTRDQAVDLEYAQISLYPELKNIFKKEGEDWIWYLKLMGHPGDPISIGRYALNLQNAGVSFFLSYARDILKRFNKQVGYRKRSLRRKEKERRDSAASENDKPRKT